MSKYYSWNGSVAFGGPLYPGDQQVKISVVKIGLVGQTVIKGNSAGSIELSNPFNLANATGKINFFGKRGLYDITASRGNFSAKFESVYIGPIAREKINKTSSFELTEDEDYTWIETTGTNNIEITIPNTGLDTDFDICGTHYGSGDLSFAYDDEIITLTFPDVFANGIPQYGTWGLTKSLYAGENIWNLFGTQNLAA